jgi:hypothetical protein
LTERRPQDDDPGWQFPRDVLARLSSVEDDVFYLQDPGHEDLTL